MSSVEQYITKKPNWKTELELLRKTAKETGLNESIKWGVPVYSIDGKNILGLAAFKHYVGIWFYNGVYLKDKSRVLINAQENKTRALRQWRFEKDEEINTELIKAYILEAIENQKKGLELKPVRKNIEIPQELFQALARSKELRMAFERLSSSKQGEYAEYIATAKRINTKLQRIEKIRPLIRDGQGLHDKYR